MREKLVIMLTRSGQYGKISCDRMNAKMGAVKRRAAKKVAGMRRAERVVRNDLRKELGRSDRLMGTLRDERDVHGKTVTELNAVKTENLELRVQVGKLVAVAEGTGNMVVHGGDATEYVKGLEARVANMESVISMYHKVSGLSPDEVKVSFEAGRNGAMPSHHLTGVP